MKKEDLFEAFGTLDEELLRRSELEGNRVQKRNGIVLKFGSLAACLVIIICAGIFFINGKNKDLNEDSNNPVMAEKNENTASEKEEIQEQYIDIKMLLASNEGITEQLLAFKYVTINEYTAVYHNVKAAGSDILKESLGSEVEEMQGWYYVSGHKDMQYLILNENETYSLWKFDSFQKDSYPYSDVLQMIYQIQSAEDIIELIVNPATMDNTEEGKAIQNEIGTTVITEKEKLEVFYKIISKLLCYGSDQWERIGLGEDSRSAMLNQVKSGRYLTFVTAQGLEVDSLKYTGISGMFYEYGGIAYSELTEEDRSVMEEVLNIEQIEKSEDISKEQADVPEKDTEKEEPQRNDTEKLELEKNDTVVDVPVNEDTYQEARPYESELEDLQKRITEAMVNKELPFVTSSAIMENPDRLHVTVTTKEEAQIAKLKEFDPTGKWLEIEYSENIIVLE